MIPKQHKIHISKSNVNFVQSRCLDQSSFFPILQFYFGCCDNQLTLIRSHFTCSEIWSISPHKGAAYHPTCSLYCNYLAVCIVFCYFLFVVALVTLASPAAEQFTLPFHRWITEARITTGKRVWFNQTRRPDCGYKPNRKRPPKLCLKWRISVPNTWIISALVCVVRSHCTEK